MSSGPNHRRGHERIADNGPTWESPVPAKGCNSTHVARSRRKYKERRHRYRRRVDKELIQGALDLGEVRDEPKDDPNFMDVIPNPLAVAAYRRSRGWTSSGQQSRSQQDEPSSDKTTLEEGS